MTLDDMSCDVTDRMNLMSAPVIVSVQEALLKRSFVRNRKDVNQARL